jgi:hypothetical protein
MQMERTLSIATRFLEEVRADIGYAALDGMNVPPRLRSVHERQGHATPEFRTLAIPVPDGAAGASPEILSGAIEHYAAAKHPDCLLLAFEAEMDGRPVLIAEARDRAGTRLYWVQPYSAAGTHVEWSEPLHGGWQDPGDEEMILDAAFRNLPPVREVETARRPRTRARA